MSGNSVVSNYGGRQPNNTSFIKQFSSAPSGFVNWIYKIIDGIKYITPATNNSVYLPKDLIVVGSINSPSDISLKENVTDLTDVFCNNILNINPKKYNFIYDENQKERYGIIAQELEEYFPELITNTGIEDMNNSVKLIKSVNYLELIPIMIVKMKNMQNEIDELKRNNN
jgi:hypothetical protein